MSVFVRALIFRGDALDCLSSHCLHQGRFLLEEKDRGPRLVEILANLAEFQGCTVNKRGTCPRLRLLRAAARRWRRRRAAHPAPRSYPSATPRAPAHTRTPRSQRTKMGLTYVHGCVHTEVPVRQHDSGWVPTPNMCWGMVRNVVKAVRDALAHAAPKS